MKKTIYLIIGILFLTGCTKLNAVGIFEVKNCTDNDGALAELEIVEDEHGRNITCRFPYTTSCEKIQPFTSINLEEQWENGVYKCKLLSDYE